MDHLVSIIVPVYKVEEYLERCVDSILGQTYKNIEVILVDDGSPDACPSICDDYAKRDSRVKVVHKKNGGLSDARNAGLMIATGEYVAFVDSDDYIANNFISVLLRYVTETNADIAVCSYYKVYSREKIGQLKNIDDTELTNIQALRDIFGSPTRCEVMTWNKLYRRRLFVDNSILFPAGKVHEDNFTTYKLFYYSTKIVYTDQLLYYYIQRDESIMGRGFNVKSLDMLEAADQAVDWIGSKCSSLNRDVAEYRFNIGVNLLNTMVDNDSIDKKIWSDVVSWIFKDNSIFVRKYKPGRKQRFTIIAVKSGKVVYFLTRKVYRKIDSLRRSKK